MANSWFKDTIRPVDPTRHRQVTWSEETAEALDDDLAYGGLDAAGFHAALYALAGTFYGLTEIKGTNHHETILGFHSCTWLNATDDETPWCSSFMCYLVNATVDAIGVDPTYLNNTPRAKEWSQWGVHVPTEDVRQGDIVILTRTGGGHVALATGLQGNGSISLLGGNQNNMVTASDYPASRVLAIRRIA